jgi:hypothetical protein
MLNEKNKKWHFVGYDMYQNHEHPRRLPVVLGVSLALNRRCGIHCCCIDNAVDLPLDGVIDSRRDGLRLLAVAMRGAVVLQNVPEGAERSEYHMKRGGQTTYRATLASSPSLA